VNQDPFPPIAFQSALTVAGVLFAVYAFLYSVYTTYTSLVTSENLRRPPIVGQVRGVCIFISVLIILGTVTAWTATLLLHLSGWDFFMAAILDLVMGAVSIFTLVWSIMKMS